MYMRGTREQYGFTSGKDSGSRGKILMRIPVKKNPVSFDHPDSPTFLELTVQPCSAGLEH